MKIYIASNFESRFRLRAERDKLVAAGHEVLSDWLDEEVYNPDPEFLRACACRDWDAILAAEMVILDTLEESRSGGREVEWGLGMGDGKVGFLVGPCRNVFHRLADARFETWEDCQREIVPNYGD